MAKALKTKAGYWIVTYRDEKGKGRSRSFGRDRAAKKQAELFALEINYKKEKGEPLPFSRAEGVYLDELCQLWIDEKKAQGRAIRWLKEWGDTFNKVFLEPLCKKPAHMVSQADVIAIIGAHYQNSSQATRNRYIGYLKSIFEHGVTHGHLKENPLARWKKGKEPRRTSKLTLADMRALQDAAPPHLAWAIEVAWNIPARPGPSDLFALGFAHVDYERGGIDVHHSKVGKDVFIPLDLDFLDDLAAREKLHKSGHLIEWAGKPIDRLDTALANAAVKAGLAYPLVLYDVRHLWITTALDKGLEPSVVAHMAGTSVQMIHKHYYEPHAVEKVRAVALMPKIREKKPAEERKVVNISQGRRMTTQERT